MLTPGPVAMENVTGFSRPPTQVLRPACVADVVAAVQQARRDGRALYPISTGMNWGYGSASPVSANSLLLDLSGMNRILNAEQVSLANPVAVIEPGVSQGQMYEFLQQRCPSLIFNVTGSARATSILGNSLDRGVGYLGPRREDLFGLQVVTGTGQVLETGFRRLGEDSPLAHTHPYGLGPMLDGLFFQGNFGIVTSACFRLLPQPPRRLAVSLALLREGELGRFIDVLACLKRERLMGSVTHVGNKARTRASLMHGISKYLSEELGLSGAALAEKAEAALAIVAPHQWTSLGGVSGTARQVSAAMAEIKARMRGLARVTTFDDGKLAMGYKLMHGLRFFPRARANAAAIAAIRPLNGLAEGVPTDAAIDNLLWRFGRSDLPASRLDDSNCGLLFINPALPMDGSFVADVVAGMNEIARGFAHELYMTLNIETENSMVAVVNLLFDRADTVALQGAHRCAAALHAYIRSRGLEVYRARADMMASLVNPADTYWQTVRGLKLALDPDNIIAPGRYNLVD